MTAHHTSRKIIATVAAIVCGMVMLAGGCGSERIPDITTTPTPSSTKSQTFTPASGKASTTLVIASGSENKEAAIAIQHAVDASKVAVTLNYMGSLDIMNLLENGADGYDAVWPASSMWISMGDTNHIVKDAQSLSTTPVVFAVRQSKAVELGWADKSGKTSSVSTADIIDAVRQGKLTFSMTSATQSNSGASAYLAFLTALAGTGTALTAADLNNTTVTGQVKELLAGVDRSSGSSDWLKDMVVKAPDDHDAMVNYESLVIAADKELTAAGKEPLLAIYPSDGIAISDSPLAYVDRGQGTDTSKAFKAFQSAMRDKTAMLELERAGRRCGLGGKVRNASDDKVKQAFRSSWGITTDSSVLKTITMPGSDIIRQALRTYQTSLRKPSYTVWVVDYSGSMYGSGKEGVVNGLRQALDANLSAESMIQPTGQDVNVLIPFSDSAHDAVTARGENTSALLDTAEQTDAMGGTNIYKGLEVALTYAGKAVAKGGYTVAIVLMTDGVSQTGDKDSFLQQYEDQTPDVPIFSIMFGSAKSSQLDDLATLSNGKVFDGRTGGLADVFREVKGYN